MPPRAEGGLADVSSLASLIARFRTAELDQCSCLVLHAEASRSAGAARSQIVALAEQGAAAMRTQWLDPLRTVYLLLLSFPAPTVAAVRRAAADSALELAACCDFIVASDDAEFAEGRVARGLPTTGAAELLTQRIGAPRAKELIFTGRAVSGRAAVTIGLSSWSVPSKRFDAELNTFIAGFSGPRSEAIRQAKLLVGPRVDPEALRQEQEAAARTLSDSEGLSLLRRLAEAPAS